MASAVTTPQPPAVVTTATRGPRGTGCVANVAAASNASSTVAARVIPAARHSPSNTLSSVASAPVWLAAARAPPVGRTALEENQWLAPRCVGRLVEQGAPVGDPFEVGEADARRRIVGEVGEVVGDRHGGGVARRDRPRDADAGGPGEVEEARHEVAALAGDGDAAGRRVGSDDLGAQRCRCADDALAVRAGEEDAEVVGEVDELLLGPLARRPRLGVAGRGHERCLDPLRRARREQVGVGGRRRAHEHEVSGAVGDLGDVARRCCTPSTHLAVQVGAVDRPGISRRQQVVQRHESELARVRRRPGDDNAAGLEQGGELLGGRRRRPPIGGSLGVGPTAARRGRRRRQALRRSRSINGLTSTLATSISLGDQTAEGDERRTPALRRSTADSPRNGPSKRRRAQIVDHLGGRGAVERRRAEHDVCRPLRRERRRRRASPSVRTAGHAPRRRSAHACRRPSGRRAGRRRRPRDGRGEQVVRSVASRRRVGEAEADEAALGLVGDAVAVELERRRESPAPRRR